MSELNSICEIIRKRVGDHLSCHEARTVIPNCCELCCGWSVDGCSQSTAVVVLQVDLASAISSICDAANEKATCDSITTSTVVGIGSVTKRIHYAWFVVNTIKVGVARTRHVDGSCGRANAECTRTPAAIAGSY